MLFIELQFVCYGSIKLKYDISIYSFSLETVTLSDKTTAYFIFA